MLVASIKENLEKNINDEINLLNTTISNYEIKSKMLSNLSENNEQNSYAFYSLGNYSRKINSYVDSINYLKNLLNELLNICKENINNECIPDKVKYYNEEAKKIEYENVSTLSRFNSIFYSYLKPASNDTVVDNNQTSITNNAGKVFAYQQYENTNQAESKNIFQLASEAKNGTTTITSQPLTSDTIKVDTVSSKESDNVSTNNEVFGFQPFNDELANNVNVQTILDALAEAKAQNKTELEIQPKAFQVHDIPVQETASQEIQENQTINNSVSKITDNNTLVISEIKNKIFLPYTVSELETILAENKKYDNIEQIIEDKYVLPMDKYRFSNKARFKETYYLMRKKEKASVFESLNIALEQTFNSSLYPAIITACKNLDELDVYLDCLDADETNKFPYFDIKYEMFPSKK